MVSQGWPLYAVAPDDGAVYAIVGWEVRPPADALPIGVNLAAGGKTAPYAVSLAHRHGKLVVTADLTTARQLAGGQDDQEWLREVIRDLRDRLLSIAVSGFDVSHRDGLRDHVLAAAESVGEGLPS